MYDIIHVHKLSEIYHYLSTLIELIKAKSELLAYGVLDRIVVVY
jgi:hypothetical protein